MGRIAEYYNKELVSEYALGSGNKTRAAQKYSHRRRIQSLKALFVEVFLPQGYPQTVSSDYIDYQLFDTIQAFASSQNSALATLAVLRGVGVGNEDATVLAAALTWLLKDGIGMLARILFAWAKGTQLDSDCKRFRLVADLLNDVSFLIDLLAPYFPQMFFVSFACMASLLRSIVGVAGGTTRMAIVRHQARRDNLADVAAKDGSQETVVNVISLLVSLALLPFVEGNPQLIWSLFLFFTATHLFANFRAVKSLRLETLNQNRFALAVRHFLQFGCAPSILHCNSCEPMFFPLGIRRHLGCSLASIISRTGADTLQMGEAGRSIGKNGTTLTWRCTPNTTVVVERSVRSSNSEGWMAVAEGASETDIFGSLFALEHFAADGSWPIESKTCAFRAGMAAAGWSLQMNQINLDEWRYGNLDEKNK